MQFEMGPFSFWTILSTCAALLFGFGVFYSQLSLIYSGINKLEVSLEQKINKLEQKMDQEFKLVKDDLNDIKVFIKDHERRIVVLEKKIR